MKEEHLSVCSLEQHGERELLLHCCFVASLHRCLFCLNSDDFTCFSLFSENNLKS